jgi:hypothetical protein
MEELCARAGDEDALAEWGALAEEKESAVAL